MTAQQEELITTLEDAIGDIDKIRQGLTAALSAGLDALGNSFFSPPGFAMDWLRDKGNEAISAFNGVSGDAQNYCNECIQNTRHCFRIRTVEAYYRGIDFSNVTSKSKADDIAGNASDAWVSANREEYVTRLGEMEDRVQRVKTSLEQLMESFTQMAQALEDRDVDLALAFASAAIGIAGILVAIYTGVTGWGAIIGLALAVIGLGISLWSFIKVFTVVPARRSEMINELTSNAKTISSDRWPAAPRLDSSTW